MIPKIVTYKNNTHINLNVCLQLKCYTKTRQSRPTIFFIRLLLCQLTKINQKLNCSKIIKLKSIQK